MDYLNEIDRQSLTRRKVYLSISPREISKYFTDETDGVHVNSTHLQVIAGAVTKYYAPNSKSNDTAAWTDQWSGYVALLEAKNRSLSTRVEELEYKFQSIAQYIPTIARIVADYSLSEERIEVKKRGLISKYSLRQVAELKLWAGASEPIDIALAPLDEIIDNDMEE